jgi:hypothetical protein
LHSAASGKGTLFLHAVSYFQSFLRKCGMKDRFERLMQAFLRTNPVFTGDSGMTGYRRVLPAKKIKSDGKDTALIKAATKKRATSHADA